MIVGRSAVCAQNCARHRPRRVRAHALAQAQSAGQVVAINASSPDSVRVGEHYAAKRALPATQCAASPPRAGPNAAGRSRCGVATKDEPSLAWSENSLL
jgi:hypothetical protein